MKPTSNPTAKYTVRSIFALAGIAMLICAAFALNGSLDQSNTAQLMSDASVQISHGVLDRLTQPQF